MNRRDEVKPELFNEAVADIAESVKPKGLIIKLCEIMDILNRIPKRGRNEFHRYDYVMEADLADALRHELASRHIFIFPNVVSSVRTPITVVTKNGPRETQLTEIEVDWTFVDGDTGESHTCRVCGVGEDNVDKGFYKAFTGSAKYMMMKSFFIPTGDDPEKENSTEVVSKAEASAVGQAKVAAAKYVTVKYSDDGLMFLWGAGETFVNTVLKATGKRNLEGMWTIPAKDRIDVLKALGEQKVEVRSDEPETVPPAAQPSERAKPSPSVRPSQPGEVDGVLADVAVLKTKNKQDFCAVTIRTEMGMETKASIFDNPQLEMVDGSVSTLFSLLVEHKGQPISAVLKVSGKYTNLVGVTRLGSHEWELTPDGPLPIRQQGAL